MKKKAKRQEKLSWTLVSLQYPQNYSVDLVNNNMKGKLLPIPLKLTCQHLCANNNIYIFKLNTETCAHFSIQKVFIKHLFYFIQFIPEQKHTPINFQLAECEDKMLSLWLTSKTLFVYRPLVTWLISKSVLCYIKF